MPPRIAGFGNRDRFELNDKIGLHRAAGQQCIGNAASGSIMLHSVAAFHCNQPEHKKQPLLHASSPLQSVVSE
jgi:hypothetical protein